MIREQSSQQLENIEGFAKRPLDRCILQGNGNKNLLIVTFGGISKKFSGTLPFEFLRFLHSHFPNYDKHFYVDSHQNWYQQGIDGFSNNIEETVQYLKKSIDKYKNVLFIGTSAGGYAAILFGSLLNINTVIAFTPQTILKSIENGVTMDHNYSNLDQFISTRTQYIVYGDPFILDPNDHHTILHCNNISHYDNVKIIKIENLSLTKMRDNGELYTIFNDQISKILHHQNHLLLPPQHLS